MKGRLREPALAAMVFALARQESFAEQTLRALERAPFVKMVRARDERVFNEVRVIEQEGVLRPQAESNYVAVFACEAREKLQRVATESEQVEERRACSF
jgi:hypothetical protein